MTTERIKQILREFGIYPNIKGYHYLTEEILIVRNEIVAFKMFTSWTELYHRIAKLYNDTYSSVDRANRFAISRAHKKQTEAYREMFKEFDKIPAASEFISMIAERVASEAKYG